MTQHVMHANNTVDTTWLALPFKESTLPNVNSLKESYQREQKGFVPFKNSPKRTLISFWDSLCSSEPSQCRRGENTVEEVQLNHLLPFLLARQGEVDHLVHTVVDGPVKLVRLVTGNDQHEPDRMR